MRQLSPPNTTSALPTTPPRSLPAALPHDRPIPLYGLRVCFSFGAALPSQPPRHLLHAKTSHNTTSPRHSVWPRPGIAQAVVQQLKMMGMGQAGGGDTASQELPAGNYGPQGEQGDEQATGE